MDCWFNIENTKNVAMKGFRLISLKLEETEEYDSGFYQFGVINNREKPKLPFTTLLIGPNGTGKSRLLKIIVDIFNDLYNYKIGSGLNLRFSSYFCLIYTVDKDVYEVENNRELIFKKNDDFSDIQKIELPEKAIVAGYSLYEKFSPKSNQTQISGKRKTRYDNSFYKYLGLKSERNYTFSGSYINRSIDLIVEALADEGFKKEVSHVFKLLNFLPQVSIKYRHGNFKDLYSGNITIGRIKEIMQQSSYRASGFGYGALNRLENFTDEWLYEITVSLNEMAEYFGYRFERQLDLRFEENFNYADFRRIYKHIAKLRSVGFLNYAAIFVYKIEKGHRDARKIDLKSMSSGEIQILTSMLALSSIVKENSLVLIDEPEISLHPNWQIQFVDILNKIFKKYCDTHFIIASHSHFLVSNLKKESSGILSLTKDRNLNIMAEFLGYDTYGWSSENILYNVFNVATVRNHYFEMDIGKVLKFISSDSTSNIREIKKILTKLSGFNITANDPLNLLLKKAKSKIDAKGDRI